MRVHTWFTIAWLTALASGGAGLSAPADAQEPPASERRIRVQKESTGEVVRRDSAVMADSIARADSLRADSLRADSLARAEATQRDSLALIEQARADSIRADSMARADAARTDSMAMADSLARMDAARADSMARESARLDSIARADSIQFAASQVPSALARRGIYFSLAGGWSTPSGDYGTPYEPGWNATVALGWQRAASRLGLRLEGTYDSHGGDNFSRETYPPVIGDPPDDFVSSNLDVETGAIWSGNLALTLDLLQWGANKGGALYLVGGGGIHYFEAPRLNFTPRIGPGTGNTNRYEGNSQTVWGLNGGGGIAFGIGRAAIFLESRYFTAYTDNSNSDWVPVIVGLKWF
ncbi:MAG TPA: hypothetical protein VLE53_20040 [Gemmatimonadaceae bacterium]|nr:hypothetical protein [Gemmatimonadaceae bacterium]